MMNEVNYLAAQITERYGTVKRARGCFLYTAKGVRLTDLYQEAGRAILGWGGTTAFTVLKNVLSRGITGSFDTDFTPRADSSAKNPLARAVSELLAGERNVFVFSSKQSALKLALEIAPQGTSVFRPWSENVRWSEIDAVIIEPPLAWTQGIWILAVRPELPCVVESVRLAAPLCAAVTRSIYNLIAALQNRSEKDWFIYDTVLAKYWTRKGPYLFPKIAKERYADFVLHCLDCGVVISPVYDQPSIVPFGADRGVFAQLRKNPFLLAESVESIESADSTESVKKN